MIELLDLAEVRGSETLKSLVVQHLESILSLNNSCVILDTARRHSLDGLADQSLIIVDENAEELLNHKTFTTLSKSSLCELLKRDSFYAPEIEIYRGVEKWLVENVNADSDRIVSFF